MKKILALAALTLACFSTAHAYAHKAPEAPLQPPTTEQQRADLIKSCRIYSTQALRDSCAQEWKDASDSTVTCVSLAVSAKRVADHDRDLLDACSRRGCSTNRLHYLMDEEMRNDLLADHACKADANDYMN